MKKSKQVPAGMIATMAAGLLSAGCGSSSTSTVRACIDNLGKQMPDSTCVANGGASGMNPHWETLTNRSGTYYRSYGGNWIPIYNYRSYGGSSYGGSYGGTGRSGFGGSSSSSSGGFGG